MLKIYSCGVSEFLWLFLIYVLIGIHSLRQSDHLGHCNKLSEDVNLVPISPYLPGKDVSKIGIP
jgi:hypothetical protein